MKLVVTFTKNADEIVGKFPFLSGQHVEIGNEHCVIINLDGKNELTEDQADHLNSSDGVILWNVI